MLLQVGSRRKARIRPWVDAAGGLVLTGKRALPKTVRLREAGFVAPLLVDEARYQTAYAAVGSGHLEQVAERLESQAKGPVIYDGRTMGATYYVLIEHRQDQAWTHHDIAPLLGRGTYLGVPRWHAPSRLSHAGRYRHAAPAICPPPRPSPPWWPSAASG
ncbi:hypothetical protein [Streptomyces sp. NPDC055060]